MTSSSQFGAPPSPAESNVLRWYHVPDFHPDHLRFTQENRVKGGTVEALVVYLTHHSQLDVDFFHDFLLTYRSFMSSVSLMQALERRFGLNYPLQEEAPGDVEQWVRNKLEPVRDKVCVVLRSWLETYCLDSDDDREALSYLRAFFHRTLAQSLPAVATEHLFRLLETRETPDGLNVFSKTSSSGPFPPPPKPILPSASQMRKLKLLDLDPLETARQLTLIESEEFDRILPWELLDKAWGDESSPEIAANVKFMFKLSNLMSGWVAHCVTSERDVKKRAITLKYFITVAEKCLMLNNFNTLVSILAGLTIAPIHRLKRTWSHLPVKQHQVLEHLKSVMEPSKNYSRYREYIRTIANQHHHFHNHQHQNQGMIPTPSGCVPFLGVFLTDLTFTYDGTADFMSTSSTPGPQIVNFAKRAKVGAIIRSALFFQSVPYALTPAPEVQSFLRQQFRKIKDEASLYKLSLDLEPKEREEERAARMLIENGFV
ncbi:ras guanine nucleotide exchange factor domain-containing protein [Zopfochytrium polystomum]|nr:ras guanine nucleotide exchange factor domain-containing protein [Zopfochytrium polystomum]